MRVIIGDKDIKDTLYGTRKIYRDVVIMTFKEFRHNTNTHHKYSDGKSHDINNTGRTEKSENPRRNRHIEVEDSRNKSYHPLGKKNLLLTRELVISNYLNCTIEQALDMRYTRIILKGDHLWIDIPCKQNQHLSTNMRPSVSTTNLHSMPHFKFTQSQPHHPSERTVPSDELVQNQQPDGSLMSATLKRMQPAQNTFSDAVLAQSKQSQKLFQMVY